jgi:hypothetical protein
MPFAMPSPSRPTDHAVVDPYLPSNHRLGQKTLIPPDNAGRVRKGKGTKPRPRQESNNMGLGYSEDVPQPASAKCQSRIRVFAGFHQFPSFLKLRNPETTKPIATVSSLSVLFSRDIDSFSGFHKFHRFPYLVLPKVSRKWDISPQVTGFPGFKLVFGGFLG